MRFHTLALLAGAVVLGACSSGEKQADTMAAATPATTTPGAPAAGAVAAMPATGTTHEVKMFGDDKGYRYDPANLTIKEGDAVKFVMVSGGPHNVSFDPTTIPAGSQDQLNANMPQEMAELSSPLLMNPDESYTISFAGVKPGVYPYHCTPHLAMNMKGTITVE